MACLEIGALIGSEGAFVAEPVLVEPGTYGVWLLDVVGGLFFSPDGVEGFLGDDGLAFVCAVMG